MLVEFGNHGDLPHAFDDRPKVTVAHIPEADEHGLGGYTHKPGMDVAEFVDHVQDSILNRDRIFHLPDHEILLSLTQEAWRYHAAPHLDRVFVGGKEPSAGDPDLRPKWVHVTPHDLTPDGVTDDVERFLTEYYNCPTGREYFNTTDPEELHVKKELSYWTRTMPGELPGGPQLPNAGMLYTNNGRVMSNINDGGGQVGAIGVGSAATGTTLTVSGTPGWASNQYAGYRIVVYSTASNNMVWGNITANGTGTNPSITVDRWYTAATPGGAAGTTPGTPWSFMILDGGFVSTWFVGLATGANAPAATDTTLSTNGNAEITTVGGGLIRKIAPYAQTSGVASRQFTLIPVFTANGTDTLPATVTTIGVFASMVVGTVGTMKFETVLTPSSATLSANGDQLTTTESVSGS